MKSLSDYIFEAILLERNEKIFPVGDNHSKFTLLTGDHCRQRQEERKVSDKSIIGMVFTAWQEMNSLFKDGKIDVWTKEKPGTNIIVADCRKDRNNPECAVFMISKNHGSGKLAYPTFIAKTVFKKDEQTPDSEQFAALLRGGKSKRNEQVIYLY